MQLSTISTSCLLKLSQITSEMVSQGRMTNDEAIELLAKAGLTINENNVWVDENGSIYSGQILPEYKVIYF